MLPKQLVVYLEMIYGYLMKCMKVVEHPVELLVIDIQVTFTLKTYRFGKTISRGELIKWGFANYAHYHRDSSGAENKTINTSIENHEKRIVQLENQVAELININKELMEMIKK